MHHPTDRITHTMDFVTPVVEHWLEREIAFLKGGLSWKICNFRWIDAYSCFLHEYMHIKKNKGHNQNNFFNHINPYNDYDEFANEIPFVDDILQPFQLEPVFTAAEIQTSWY